MDAPATDHPLPQVLEAVGAITKSKSSLETTDWVQLHRLVDEIDDTEISSCGWDLALLLMPHLNWSTLDEANSSHAAVSKILGRVASNVAARELLVFVPEYMLGMTLDPEELPRLLVEVPRLVACLQILIQGLGRIQPNKLFQFIHQTLSAIVPSFSVLDRLGRSLNSDQSPNGGDESRAVVIHAVESLIAEFTACCNLLGEQLAKSTDSKNAEHVAFACKGFYMKIFSMGLSRLPLGLVYQSKPRLWTAPIQDKLLASAQGLGIGAFNILEDHTASFQSFGDIAVFIALVLERDSREGSARFLGTHMLPKVVGRPWKLATAIPLGVVLFGQSSTGNPDDVFIADKALVYLQYLSQHLATESLHMEDYQMDYDGYSMNELIQNSLQFMAGCHAPGLRSVAFAKFKTFLRVFDHTVILHIIAEIMTKSGQPILEVAALAILKEFVHEFWNRPHDSGRHQSPKPNTFASPVLTETLLKLLLDPKQSFYLDPVVPSRTVLNDRQTLLRSSDVVMHVLNLYLYLLIRDLPSRKLGLWDKSHLDATRRAFLDPLARHVERLAQEQENQHCQQHAEETDHDDGVDHACAADPTKSLLLNMMQSTLSRIEEITTTADQDEQE